MILGRFRSCWNGSPTTLPCLAHFERLRWPGGFIGPVCRADGGWRTRKLGPHRRVVGREPFARPTRRARASAQADGGASATPAVHRRGFFPVDVVVHDDPVVVDHDLRLAPNSTGFPKPTVGDRPGIRVVQADLSVQQFSQGVTAPLQPAPAAARDRVRPHPPVVNRSALAVARRANGSPQSTTGHRNNPEPRTSSTAAPSSPTVITDRPQPAGRSTGAWSRASTSASHSWATDAGAGMIDP